MRPFILLSAQLRSTLPRSVRRDLNSKLFTRLKTTQNPVQPPKSEVPFIKRNTTAPRNPQPSPAKHARLTFRKGPPERILIYHGGTGKTAILGTLRMTTIIIFGVSCFLVAPAFYTDEHPWYLAPAIVIASAFPMLFVTWTSAPYVTFVHLALPVFARRSREATIEYAKNLPQTATLYATTMRATSMPMKSEMRLGDLVPDKSFIRPVSFTNLNPAPTRWWEGKSPKHFYTDTKSKPGRPSSTFYPALWEHVYKQIQNNGALKKK
ncbi:hypothetical protein ASPCADRAFT_128136 [Aspergillus carbonarius ITEM 5010]|uniref:Uncharacterized protein n=1 Tax=Aspergillus carbonarius (strain ITEM 5010) TaxID=602072 RepID=A0A1R3RU02_ASPC5|nr:hypothetical protein ASPCADRAFT_128136 [Aspergillus carbonarius ITEM 5010]